MTQAPGFSPRQTFAHAWTSRRSHRWLCPVRPERGTRQVDIGVHSKVYPGGMTLTVSKLAARASLTADTIRYYERAGLLPASRTESGYRAYVDEAVEILRFIKGAQRIGLRLQEIKELLDIRDRGLCPCGHTEDPSGQL